MAGKRITDLALAPTLFGIDYIPVARDTQTVRVPGSAIMTTNGYESDRAANLYARRKYELLDGVSNYVIRPDSNNKNVVIDNVSNFSPSISKDNGEYFPLGFEIDFTSLDMEGFSFTMNNRGIYSFVNNNGELASEQPFSVFGGVNHMDAYDTIRVSHIAPNVWLKRTIMMGDDPVANAIIINAAASQQPIAAYVDDSISLSAVVIDTTGAVLSATTIASQGTYLATIASSSTTMVSIQGANAYTLV